MFPSNSIRLYLGLDSKKTTAVLGPAVARCPPITQTVQVVIKGQFRVWRKYDCQLASKQTFLSLFQRKYFVFLTSSDITQSEESYPHISVHGPLLSLTVGTAAVVHKAWQIPFGSSINHTILRNTGGLTLVQLRWCYNVTCTKWTWNSGTFVRVSM